MSIEDINYNLKRLRGEIPGRIFIASRREDGTVEYVEEGSGQVQSPSPFPWLWSSRPDGWRKQQSKTPIADILHGKK